MFKRKELAQGDPPITAQDQVLLKQTVAHYKEKLERRQALRQKKMENHEKCIKRRNSYQTDVEERREKKDNVVYFDGTNYTVRWTCMPR